jgi:hypothetical protein
MARSRSNAQDNTQVLTISLVLFVLLSLVLGGTTYLGYSDSADWQKKYSEAKSDAKRRSDERDQNKLLTSTYRVLTGYDDKEDLKIIEGLKREHNEAFTQEIKKHEKTIPWENNQKLPTTTYAALIEQQNKKVTEAVKGMANCKEQSDKALAASQKDRAQILKAKEDVEKALKDTTAKIDENFKGIGVKYDEAIASLIKALPENENKEKKIQELERDLKKAKDDLARAQKDIETKIRKLEDKIPQIDILAYDQPKGKVVTVDRTGTTVSLNVGSVDNVRPGLTFSVFGTGEYKPNAERKASVEVVTVYDRHCMARVTETKSATRDPVLTGDLLYNPAWTPGLREHVAIAGFIDLTGDGRDETPEFVRLLQKQGVVVDAYLDLKEKALKGESKEINRQTSYLILGELPNLDKGAADNAADPRLERKMNIHEEVQKLHEKAKALGVTIVPARRFMALVGMKAPKANGPTDWTTYTLKGVGNNEKKEDGEMKKDDKAMKKDEKKDDK